MLIFSFTELTTQAVSRYHMLISFFCLSFFSKQFYSFSCVAIKLANCQFLNAS